MRAKRSNNNQFMVTEKIIDTNPYFWQFRGYGATGALLETVKRRVPLPDCLKIDSESKVKTGLEVGWKKVRK